MQPKLVLLKGGSAPQRETPRAEEWPPLMLEMRLVRDAPTAIVISYIAAAEAQPIIRSLAGWSETTGLSRQQMRRALRILTDRKLISSKTEPHGPLRIPTTVVTLNVKRFEEEMEAIRVVLLRERAEREAKRILDQQALEMSAQWEDDDA